MSTDQTAYLPSARKGVAVMLGLGLAASGVFWWLTRDSARWAHCRSGDLAFLPGASIALVITSPPYNFDVAYDGYHDVLPYDRYLEWVGRWARALRRAAIDRGRACINVPLDSNKGGSGREGEVMPI